MQRTLCSRIGNLKGRGIFVSDMIGGNSHMKKYRRLLSIVVLLIMVFCVPVYGEETKGKEIEIVFTHDLHSHLDSFTTEIDGEQQKAGGFSRIATVIQQKKKENPATLVVDAGDFSMGTLYQTIYESEASELRMLGKIGFDATTLGNHETDYRNQGLANMLNSAKNSGDPLPQFVLSNLSFEGATKEELVVKEAMENYGAKSYTIIEKDGIKIGLLGIFGKTSIEYSPMCTLTFEDQVESAKKAVKALKEEGADLIVCLSHSGTDPDPKKSEDEILAKEVPDIDVIISGHTHTRLDEPIIVGNTVIGSTGEYGIRIGSMKLVKESDDSWQLKDYELIPITSDIKEDDKTKKELEQFHKIIEKEYLSQYGYKMGQVLAENDVAFTPMSLMGKRHQEENLGNFIADSYISTIKKEEGDRYDPIAVAVVPAGVVRETLPKGEVRTEDAFMVMSLGIGKDKVPGYPIISVYLTGEELKTVAEVDASIAPMMEVAQLYTAGLHFKFNPNRLLLNKVTSVTLWDEETGEPQPLEDDKLYRVVADLYSGQMLSAVESKSFGLLKITPKDKNGKPIENLEDQIVYRADGKELKAWICVADYLQSFKGENTQEVSKVPSYYETEHQRKVVDDSKDFMSLVSAPNKFTWMALGIIGIFVLLIAVIVIIIYKKVRKK